MSESTTKIKEKNLISRGSAYRLIMAVVVIAVIVFGAFSAVKHYQEGRRQREAQIERQGMSLQEAISLNNLDAVKFLVKNGADIEYRDVIKTANIDSGKAKNAEGYTALGWAMFTNRPEIARYLIEQGADITASTPMETMLFWALSFKMEDIAVRIINGGGDIYPARGYNPAAHAKILGMENIVSLLAEKGIRPGDFALDVQSASDANKKLEK